MDASSCHTTLIESQLNKLKEMYKTKDYYERMGKFATHKRKNQILKALQYVISHHTMIIDDPTNKDLKINTVSYYMERRDIESKQFFNLASEEGKNIGNTKAIIINGKENPAVNPNPSLGDYKLPIPVLIALYYCIAIGVDEIFWQSQTFFEKMYNQVCSEKRRVYQTRYNEKTNKLRWRAEEILESRGVTLEPNAPKKKKSEYNKMVKEEVKKLRADKKGSGTKRGRREGKEKEREREEQGKYKENKSEPSKETHKEAL